MKKITYALVAVSVLGLSSLAHAAATSEITASFVKDGSIGGMFEVESSKLALQKSDDAEIKSFAQKMIDDHSKANKKMKAAVKKSKLDPTLIAKSLDKKHQDMLNELKEENGKDFNEKYIDEQVAAHDEAVKLFSDYSENGDDATLKTFATKTLPTLKMHQDHIKMLEDKK